MSLAIADLFSVKDKHVVVTHWWLWRHHAGSGCHPKPVTIQVKDGSGSGGGGGTASGGWDQIGGGRDDGGGRGIGRMISEGYVRNGAIVYIASRDAAACDKTAAELTSMGPGKCLSLPGDLASVAGCKALVEKLKNQYQLTKLHILVNNSGASWGEALEKFPESGWDKIMNLNVKSPFFLTQAMLPLLIAAGTKEDPARVINIGSITGESIQFAPTYSYDVSKAAVHHLTRKLARDLAPHHITVNAIAPGFVPTKMGSQLLTYNGEEKMIAVIPMGRSGRTSDMAGVALYLSSQAAAWTTGIVIPVDGGALVYRPSKL